jgi:hypothetical protein
VADHIQQSHELPSKQRSGVGGLIGRLLQLPAQSALPRRSQGRLEDIELELEYLALLSLSSTYIEPNEDGADIALFIFGL